MKSPMSSVLLCVLRGQAFDFLVEPQNNMAASGRNTTTTPHDTPAGIELVTQYIDRYWSRELVNSNLNTSAALLDTCTALL